MPKDSSKSSHAGPSSSIMNASMGRSSAVQVRRSSGAENHDYRYDPMGNPEKKRDVRKNYRDLINKAHIDRSNLDDISTKDLQKNIETANKLIKNVEAPSESVLDSHFLAVTAEIAAQKAKGLKVGSEFEIEDFLTKTCSLIGGKLKPVGYDDGDDLDDLDDGMTDSSNWRWDLLGLMAVKYQRKAITMDHLLGPLEVTHNKRTVVRRQADEKAGPAVKPQQLQAQDISNNTNETSSIVQRIAGLLQRVGGSKGINLFEFAIDPTSFSNTVENLFHISFLIRDGKASIDTDNENEEPILLSCEQAQQEDYEAGLKKRQIVFELDVETWRGLVEAYSIRRAIIPHENVDQSHMTDTWATSRPA